MPWICAEKRDFALGWIQREQPVVSPLLNTAHGFLQTSSGGLDVWVLTPDSHVISVERGRRVNGQCGGKVVDVKNEKNRGKDRALGDTTFKSLERRQRRIRRGPCPTVREKRVDPSDKAGRKAETLELMDEARMPDRVKGFGEVQKCHQSSVSWFLFVKPVRDTLGQAKDLIHSRPSGTETSL